MMYEKMKKWGFDRKRKQVERSGQQWNPEVDKLASFYSDSLMDEILTLMLQSNISYTVMSGASKIGALSATYPYQVIRSRLQVSVRVIVFCH